MPLAPLGDPWNSCTTVLAKSIASAKENNYQKIKNNNVANPKSINDQVKNGNGHVVWEGTNTTKQCKEKLLEKKVEKNNNNKANVSPIVNQSKLIDVPDKIREGVQTGSLITATSLSEFEIQEGDGSLSSTSDDSLDKSKVCF
uniref:Uncharacterized protein n=1 Tax=Strongyloides papillosus TaxID=174720 RepID=A0A0N5B4F5_STREA